MNLNGILVPIVTPFDANNLLNEAALERLTREVAAVSGTDEAGAAKKVDDVLVSRAA